MTRTARTSWFFSREGERPAYTSTQCILPAGDALPAFQTIPLEFEPFEFQIPTSRSGFAILRSYPVLFGSNHRYSSIDLNLAIPPGTTNQAFQPLLIARDSGLRALRLHDVPLRSRLRFANTALARNTPTAGVHAHGFPGNVATLAAHSCSASPAKSQAPRTASRSLALQFQPAPDCSQHLVLKRTKILSIVNCTPTQPPPLVQQQPLDIVSSTINPQVSSAATSLHIATRWSQQREGDCRNSSERSERAKEASRSR